MAVAKIDEQRLQQTLKYALKSAVISLKHTQYGNDMFVMLS